MVPPGGFHGSSDEHAVGTNANTPMPKNNGIAMILVARVALLIPPREREQFMFFFAPVDL
jgi:hypothetical protein